MKTKACALVMAVIMLFSFVCTAENGYVSISDPYYTDGTNVYDFAGLSANVSYARAEEAMQLILRAVTSYGQTSCGVQTEGDTLYLYADGFSNSYQLQMNDLIQLLAEATDGNVDISSIVNEFLSGKLAGNEEAANEISIKQMVLTVYEMIYKDGSQLSDAASCQVDTFLHTRMNAFVVPIELTAEEIDLHASGICAEMDARGLMSEEIAAIMDADSAGGADAAAVSFAEIYEKNIKPLNLNAKGNAFYGENDVFIEWNLCSGDKVILPVFLEVTNTEKPSLYLNISLEDDSFGKKVVYATVESSEDGRSDYLEYGMLEDDRTVALVTYQVYENAGIPVQDFYLGITRGNSLYNFSVVNTTDHETTRSIYINAYLDGVEAQLSYTGGIASDYGDRNEQGVLQFATNLGIQAKVNVGFGSGSGALNPFIPEGVSAKEIVSMNEADHQIMMKDFQNLADSFMTILVMGVPGMAQLFGMEDAQG